MPELALPEGGIPHRLPAKFDLAPPYSSCSLKVIDFWI
jgi:hypothetical protein